MPVATPNPHHGTYEVNLALPEYTNRVMHGTSLPYRLPQSCERPAAGPANQPPAASETTIRYAIDRTLMPLKGPSIASSYASW